MLLRGASGGVRDATAAAPPPHLDVGGEAGNVVGGPGVGILLRVTSDQPLGFGKYYTLTREGVSNLARPTWTLAGKPVML